ncbi:MAG: hypothetical protein RL085_307, partial [Actinomycetota bacterium]
RKNNPLYVGEAAGLQDCLFGFGMRYAMLSGFLAARSLTEGEDYDCLCREAFGHRLTVGANNRRLYALRSPVTMVVLRTFLEGDWRNKFGNDGRIENVAGPEFWHLTWAKQSEQIAVSYQGLEVSPSLLDLSAKNLVGRSRFDFRGEVAFENLHVEPLNVSRETMQA